MATAALKHQTHAARRRKPHLSLVPTTSARPSKRKSKAAQASAARDLFTVFAILVIVVSILGLGRVWLSVQAAEASIRANELRGSIKSERYEGDMLEVRQSALGSPSRIRGIAANTMQMTSSRKVTYVRLDSDAQAHKTAAGGNKNTNARGALSRMMDLAAGEAQVLLVGSIGLARSK